MEKLPDPRPDDAGPPEIASAEALFRDAPAPAPPAPPEPPHAAPRADAGQYDLGAAVEATKPRWTPPVEPDRPRREAAAPPRLEPSRAVEQTWSRWAEWGGTIGLLFAVGLGLLILLYATLSVELYGVAVLVLVVGGAAVTVLSYPILITLERPVRVTPEQALSDYYGALSHHVPHYRRMWLLLSTAGRVSGSFASFEGFRAYWKARLAELRDGRCSPLTPLKLQVADFRSEKSAGRTEIEVSYAVRVSVRGRSAEGPVAEFPMKATLVKGPDRMWYLDRGTLP